MLHQVFPNKKVNQKLINLKDASQKNIIYCEL